MINGAHVILYSHDAEALREFFRDKLDMPNVDAGGGWLIFGLPPAEVAMHPQEGEASHELFLMCDDVEATVAKLEAKGVEFEGGIEDRRYGLATTIKLPDGGRLGLYQPRHPTAHGG